MSSTSTDAEVQPVQPDIIWVSALDAFLSSLDEDDRRKVNSVSGVDNMLHHVQELRVEYRNSRLIRVLDRLLPFMRWIKSYSECMKIYIEGAPRALVLLWGSLSLVIEVGQCFGVHRSTCSHELIFQSFIYLPFSPFIFIILLGISLPIPTPLHSPKY